MTVADAMFQLYLRLEVVRVEHANGLKAEDYKYAQVESVRNASLTRYVYVTFEGVEYGPVSVDWNALDGDKTKSTVLIQTNQGIYYTLWFFDSVVKTE